MEDWIWIVMLLKKKKEKNHPKNSFHTKQKKAKTTEKKAQKQLQITLIKFKRKTGQKYDTGEKKKKHEQATKLHC